MDGFTFSFGIIDLARTCSNGCRGILVFRIKQLVTSLPVSVSKQLTEFPCYRWVLVDKAESKMDELQGDEFGNRGVGSGDRVEREHNIRPVAAAEWLME